MSWYTSSRKDRLPPWWTTFTKRYLQTHRVCALKYSGCLIEATEVDHIVPGDDHSIENLQPVCERCHAKKSSREGNLVRSKLRSQKKRPPRRHPGSRY